MSDKLTIANWSPEDQPRERLRDLGAHVLSDAELLAILVGSGSPGESAVELMKRILSSCNNNLNTLGKLSIHELMQYSDFIFGDQDEWEVATGVRQVPMDQMMADSTLDMDAYRRYFDEMHRQFPHCREMMLGLRNQLTTNHHTLTALLWCDGTIYRTRIYDITHIVDPVGVGDAFVAAYIHAAEKWKGDPQRGLDFATAAAMMKNSVVGDFNLVTEEEILEQLG